MINKKLQSGFALLMSIIVIGVVVSVGLSLASLTIKQLNLSTNSKESETAFHSANAGVECAQYIRYKEMDLVEVGDDVPFACFGLSSTVSPSNPDSILGVNVSAADAYLYKERFSWAGDSRCSDISMLIVVSNDTDDKGMISGLKNIFPGYPDEVDDFVCEVGGRCAIISAEGYSDSCDNVGNIGVVQREVLITS